MKLTYTVSNNQYQNIKEVLKIEFSMSDRLIVKLKKLQKIFLNGKSIYIHYPIKLGDIIECDLDYLEENENVVPTPMPLNIVAENDEYIVINKPSNMPVHPSRSHYKDSLSNGVCYYFNQIGLHKKVRPVNRLDIDTTGLVIFAKNEYIQECFVKQMKNKIFKKKYLTIVTGHLENKEGTISLPISRKQGSIIERTVSKGGMPSITHYKVLYSDYNNNYDLVECTLETGRTHQIRVHFSYIGHPVLGDTLYGTSSSLIPRQALHSYQITLQDPITKNITTYTANMPEDFPCKNL